MDNLKKVINTPLEDMDNKAVILDNNDFYGFQNWQGVQNKGRWFGRLVYRTKSGMVASGQGTSAKGYTSKDNALKYARIDFENNYNERILPNLWQLFETLVQLKHKEKRTNNNDKNRIL